MNKLRKLLGEFVHSPEHIIRAIQKPEDIDKLTPEEFSLYKEALDKVFGPKEERMAKLGFDTSQQFVKLPGKDEYTLSQSLKDYLRNVGKAEETVIVKDLGKPLDISKQKNIKEVIDKYYPDQLESVGNTKVEQALQQFADDTKRPLFNPETNTYQLPETVIKRDINAAFDPRFAYSKHKLAGVIAAPAISVKDEISPLPFLKKAVEVYDNTKEKLAEFLAKEMSLDKSYQTHEDIQKVLEIALDPANILGVGSGLIFESIKELIKAHK